MKPTSFPRLLALSLVLLSPAVARADGDTTAQSPETASKPDTFEDARLAPEQSELLDLAFRAASAMPTLPHAKNRARAQEEVAQTALDLEAPARALDYVEQIDNWRRAAGLAECAVFAAEHGQNKLARELIERARARMLATAESPSALEPVQDWMVDRTKAALARAYHRMGESEEARNLARGIGDADALTLREAWVETLADGDFDSEFRAIEAGATSREIDPVRFALHSAVGLHARFYADPKRREMLEAVVRDNWSVVPLAIRIDLLIQLADGARTNGDNGRSLILLAEAREHFDAARWLVQDRLPVLARFAVARHQSGAVEAAHSDGVAAHELALESIATVVDVFRAAALRPLAEAFAEMGDVERARQVYALAIEHGLVNPNSRPRAQDLVATACSLARHPAIAGVALMVKLREAFGGLGDPW